MSGLAETVQILPLKCNTKSLLNINSYKPENSLQVHHDASTHNILKENYTKYKN